ncbi:cytochrome c oxidase subunit 3 [Roseiconus lacunae]|uniref:Cytochrome c oxidase subunit 3 n=1 Tax=Roseiconus lacunae TaxID=2605694 RepID=A0ABT7PQ29_9BACT|nr:cytochrome c oxidase subunit 3 [Roseiconus lacunae]MCD0461898.1 cytochrome c oxidase subunit 3 [Roseiconus lacunae]MDM4018609.1 cytochrome c oxidase subunit 3 [Roseiconus lacunae]WRQ52663.1 cytochrome c oxidase subunit 3 [Stieleria sp. HD01]
MSSDTLQSVSRKDPDEVPRPVLPADRRVRQGGWIFIGSLLVFFVTSILLYGIYAYSRWHDSHRAIVLPNAFLISTVCLLVVSGFVHAATRSVRRDRFQLTAGLLGASTLAAVLFMLIQCWGMLTLLLGRDAFAGTGQGVAGMVIVLAILHALHVFGGIIALGIVAARSLFGHYDHERHWPVDFAAHYWHFLDLVWISMMIAFWTTTGGFRF